MCHDRPGRWPGGPTKAPTGGMGLSLVRNIAGPIEYQRLNNRNHVKLRIAGSGIGGSQGNIL